MKTDNRSVGGRFEQELSHLLADNGFWCHVLQQNKSGQPADLIAIMGKFHTLIDCKVVSDGNGFPFERVEENQRMAMRMFSRKAMESCWFALKLPDESVWMVTSGRIEMMMHKGKKRMTDSEIRTIAWPLGKWLLSAKEWSEDI